MGQKLISDSAGLFTCDLDVHGFVLDHAVERREADEVLRCAVIIALCVLAQGGAWPDVLMELLADFMLSMRACVIEETSN
jgi:hypothetical protein